MTDNHSYSSLAMFVGSEEITAGGRNSLPIVNPADGETIAQLPLADITDLDAAIAAAEAAFPSWSAVAPAERCRILKKSADLIRERIEEIAVVMTLEQGKPLAEARAEILYGANVIEWYAEEGKRAYGRIIPSPSPELRHLVVKEPVGVSVAFTPWNFPALTPCRKIGGALAAGCTLVLKAAEETPGTAVEIARALFDAGLPRGALNLVFGDPAEVSGHLIASPVVRKVSFTGSVPVGKILMRLAADGAKRTTMELGGHAPVIVFADADVDKAASMLAAAKFRNAGQVCISPTRFYVEKSAYERFVDKFAACAKALQVGDGVLPDTSMGPLANERRVAAMERLVADAVEKGAKVETGGRRIGNKGFFFEPTVLSDVSDDALIMNEEPFGPVAPVTSFNEFDEVMARANGLPFGLAAYAFTGSNKTAMRASAQLKSGMVGLNTMAISSPETPFGGVKESGHGQEGGAEGLDAYLDVKLIALSEQPALRQQYCFQPHPGATQMKILVPVKRVIDYNVKVRVKSDQTGVDLANVKMSMNPFDEIAVEEAVRLKEAGTAEEIVAVSIGPEKAQDQLRQALAMGADRAILIKTDETVEPLSVAKLLKKVVEEESPELVILGKQAIDDDSNQTGQMMAALLGWSQGTFASKVEKADGALNVTREIDGGLQTIKINLPAIVTTDLRLNEPRYASLPNIMKAKKKPLDVKEVGDYGVDISPRLTTVKVTEPPKREAGVKVADVAELVSKLKSEGVL